MDEKKKVAIIGGLFAVLAGVGAFQLMGSAPTENPAPKPKPEIAEKQSITGTEKLPEGGSMEELAKTQSTPLSERDPFQPLDIAIAQALDSGIPSTPLPVASAGSVRPGPFQPMLPRGTSSGPTTIGGSLPPMPAGNIQPLPKPNASASKPEAPRFGYSLIGVMVGNRAIAVFRDTSGKQRLVEQGGSLDGDTQVTSVARGVVTIQFRGKTLRLKTGGNSQ